MAVEELLAQRPFLGGGPRVAQCGLAAFFSGAKIYLMNADGSEHRTQTRPQAGVRDLAWSPDGRKLAFLRARNEREAAARAVTTFML
jgi:Tol biopolymer transport system component